MSARKTFLLVEDDPRDVEFVESEFKEAPLHIQLRVVRDGLEAMHYVAGHGAYANRQEYPLPAVILLDLELPQVHGFQFLDWLRTEAPAPLRYIPVIVMSASLSPEDVSRAYALGANSYLVKLVNWDEFRKHIRAFGIFWSVCAETPRAVSR
jgi:CheY-like chemotaxis protein